MFWRFYFLPILGASLFPATTPSTSVSSGEPSKSSLLVTTVTSRNVLRQSINSTLQDESTPTVTPTVYRTPSASLSPGKAPTIPGSSLLLQTPPSTLRDTITAYSRSWSPSFLGAQSGSVENSSVAKSGAGGSGAGGSGEEPVSTLEITPKPTVTVKVSSKPPGSPLPTIMQPESQVYIVRKQHVLRSEIFLHTWI
jgi:hypothetical protein